MIREKVGKLKQHENGGALHLAILQIRDFAVAAACLPVYADLFRICSGGNSQIWFLERHTGQFAPPFTLSPIS